MHSRQRYLQNWAMSRLRVCGNPTNTFTEFQCIINCIASIQFAGLSTGRDFLLTCPMIDFIFTRVGRPPEKRASKILADFSSSVNLDHCFDFLRQVIMCHGDVTMTYWSVVTKTAASFHLTDQNESGGTRITQFLMRMELNGIRIGSRV